MRNKYKLKITGKNIKRFIEILIKERIYLYDVVLENNAYYVIVDDKGYEKISKIKTSYKVSLVRKYGFIRIKSLIRKYSIFLISLFISLLLLILLSHVVFDIKVENEHEEIRDIINNDLEEFGIKKFHFKVSYKEKEKIKKKILKKETEKIEWLEIDSIGTSYIVKVQERIKNKKKTKSIPQNIIAKKDSMILAIEAEHGEVKKKKYDYVKKGDVLISGIIMNKDKPMKKVKAAGSVYGEVWYKASVSLPKKYKVINKTGKSDKKVEIRLFNKSIFLFFNKYKSYNIKRKKIIYNNIIPISVNYTKLDETIVNSKNYSIENIDRSAIKIAKSKLMHKLGKKDSVIYKKVLKKTEKDSRIEVEVFFKVKEDITDTESIEDIKLEEYKEGDEGETGN